MDGLSLALMIRRRGSSTPSIEAQTVEVVMGTASTHGIQAQPYGCAFSTEDTLPAGFALSSQGRLTYDGTESEYGYYPIDVTVTRNGETDTATVTIALGTMVVTSSADVTLWAGVDTKLYIADSNGVLTASPSGSWGGTGYHSDLYIYPDIYFYPKHGLKYSLDGGTNWSNWIFEDTNSTLDMTSDGFGTITSWEKISGRDSATVSGQTLIINDPSGSSSPYKVKLVSETSEFVVPDGSDSGSESQSESGSVQSDEVWYYAPEQVTLYSQTNVVSHTFANGKGIVKYSAPLTEMPDTLRGTGITNVEMPDGITSIGASAFRDCSSLALTSLPSDITSIGASAFRNCSSVALTSLPDGITSIGSTSFYGCANLALTSLPEGLTSISNETFVFCSSLALTSLPSGITSIGNSAFNSCTSLALTSLPSDITSIGTSAFRNCFRLALTSLPSGITSIGFYAFAGCTNLALTSLPEGLTSIGSNAFAGCTSLASITFTGAPTTISSTAFADCTNLLDIYVPWAEGDVADAPWGATNATVHYNSGDQSESGSESGSGSESHSESQSESQSEPAVLPTDEAKAYLLSSNYKDSKHSSTDYDLSHPNASQFQTIDGRACVRVSSGCLYNTYVNGTRTNGCAMSMWAKFGSAPASTAGVKVFANGSSGVQNSFWIGFLNGCYAGGNGTSALGIAQSSVQCDTSWHNLVLNYDRASLKMDLWIDGTKQGTVTLSSALTGAKGTVINAMEASNSTSPDNINNEQTYYCNVKYYSRTLADAEIRGLAQE